MGHKPNIMLIASDWTAVHFLFTKEEYIKQSKISNDVMNDADKETESLKHMMVIVI